MHYVILLIFGGLVRFVPVVIARVLTAAGLGIFVAASLTTLFNSVFGDIVARLNGSFWEWTGWTVALIGRAGVSQALAFIGSCFAMRIAWDATAITIRKAVGA